MRTVINWCTVDDGRWWTWTRDEHVADDVGMYDKDDKDDTGAGMSELQLARSA